MICVFAIATDDNSKSKADAGKKEGSSAEGKANTKGEG
jgi:hypothetical protein